MNDKLYDHRKRQYATVLKIGKRSGDTRCVKLMNISKRSTRIAGLLICLNLIVLGPWLLITNSTKANNNTFAFTLPHGFGGIDATMCVTVGDLNGDGALDIVAGNGGVQSDGMQNMIYLNDGTGDFSAGISFGGVDQTSSLALGDLNGDGTLDIVVGNDFNQYNKIYLNDGPGTFASGYTFGSANGTTSLALGDLNGDGALDIIVGNSSGLNTLHLNKNDGTGTFLPSTTFGSADDAKGLAVGDLNGDGALDIVVGNGHGSGDYTHQQNRIYLNDGTGAFPVGSDLGNPDATSSVALADLDSDGALDIVIGNSTWNADEQNVIYFNNNDGSGTFSPGVPLGGPDKTQSVAAGDLNGDGALDLVIGNWYQQKSIYFNDGTGSFLSSEGFGSDAATTSVAIGDLNGDGALDVVIGNWLRQSLVYLNAQTPSFASGSSFGDTNDTWSIAVGDFNADSALDLVAGNGAQDGGAQNVVYLNNGAGILSPAFTLTITDRTWSVVTGDLNGDGALDLVVGNSEEQNLIYFNDGTGDFSSSVPFGGTEDTQSVAIGDLNGDNALDVVVGNYGAQNIVYLNDGGGNFGPGTPFGGSDSTHSIALGDLNKDGTLDLVVGNTQYNTQCNCFIGAQNIIYLNDGTGHFPSGTSFGDIDNTWSVAIGDLNGDGSLDIVVGNWLQQNLIYLNDGMGNFASGIPIGDADTTYSVAVGDLNGNGALDLVVGNGWWQNKIYLNDGMGRFPSGDYIGDEDLTTSVALGDFNADGALDFVIGNTDDVGEVYVGDQNLLYLNTARFVTGLVNHSPYLIVTRPITTGNANFYSSPSILSDTTISIPYTLIDPEGDPVGQIRAFYSPDGDGGWLAAVATTDTITTNLSTGSMAYYAMVGSPRPIPNPGTRYATLTIPDAHHITDLDVWVSIAHACDADLDVYLRSPAGTTIPLFTDVGGSGDNFNHTVLSDQAAIPIASGTAPFQGTYQPKGYLANFNDEVAKGTWTLIVTDDNEDIFLPDDGTLIAWGLNLKTSTYIFTWDTFSSGFFGQSDNTVFRIVAYPHSFTSTLTNTYRYTDSIPGPYQRPYVAATTFPFRVRGTQVRVYSETVAEDNRLAGAIVYRLSEDAGSSLLADGSGKPFRTDQNGYLQGRGKIDRGDQLLAMSPISGVQDHEGMLEFDGVDDYVSIPNSGSLNLGTNQVTLEMWVKLDRLPNQIASSFAGIYDSLEDAYVLYEDKNANELRFKVTDADGTAERPGIPAALLDTEQWHHIAGVYDGDVGSAKIYFDGVLIDTHSNLELSGFVKTGQIAAMGSEAGGGNFFPGFIDEICIWNSARGETDIQADMYSIFEGDESNLVAHWSLDDPDIATSGVCEDRTNNGNDGLLRGASWDGVYLGGYTVYHTSGTPTENGVDGFSVQEPGVQEIAVTAAHPLILFDLNVSLEWDAHNDPIYLQQLEGDLKKASEYLYDFTDGQVALGHITVYQNADAWADAHIAVGATNRLRPFAHIGGVRSDVLTETVLIDDQERALTYGPGQIRIGATWNRYGNPGQSVGVDWPLILAHELSHYLLYQYDVYIGLNDEDLLVPQDTCTGSAMGDVYNLDNTEFISDALHWSTACSQTLAAETLDRTEWTTLRAHYPWLITPTVANEGPYRMPFEFTTVEIVSPTRELDTIADPTFYLDYEGGVVSSSEARAFLLRDADLDAVGRPLATEAGDFEFVYDLGSPRGGQNRVVARGAQPGDRLCVFDRAQAQFGCEVIAASDERLTMRKDATWTSVIQIRPVNSTTFVVEVTGLPTSTVPLTLNARLYPEFGTAFTATALIYFPTVGAKGAYTGTLALPYPVLWGHVQVWADEGTSPTETAPRRETIVGFSIGGNPGPSRVFGGGPSRVFGGGPSRVFGGGPSRVFGGGSLRAGEAPMASSDGQMILYTSDTITFAEGQFYTIQAMVGLPDLPPGRTVVGQGYNLVATGFPSGTAVMTGSISIQYLGSDVLAAGVDEADLQLYFWDGAGWRALDTVLNSTYNMASAHSQGPGVYALFASVKIALAGPGWNLFAYHARVTQPVTQALLSISGYYTTIYGYDFGDSDDHWKVYDVTVPDVYHEVVNDLKTLEFGKGYWINVSQAITLHLRSGAEEQITNYELRITDQESGLPAPPATFYGPVNGDGNWAPVPGMVVTAWIDGHVCGRTHTQQVGEHVVYAVNVLAEGTDSDGCGAPGKSVTFQVDGQVMEPLATWDDRKVWEVALRLGGRIYLPLILKH